MDRLVNIMLLSGCLLGTQTLTAQVLGGTYGFAWLRSGPSTQATGLGRWQLRYDGRDPALAAWNPATLNVNTDGVVHASQDFLPTGAGRSIVAGGYHLADSDLDLGLSVQYVGFGEFEGRDEQGNSTGAFNAREYAIGASAAKHIDDRLHLGATLQVIGGSIEAYDALGIALSAGAMYTPDSARRTVVGLQLQQAGYVWNDYAGEALPLPFTLSLGISRRLQYLPLRFGILYRRLDTWNLQYDDPERNQQNDILGASTEQGAASGLLDNLARHFAFNAELYIGQNELIQVRAGYDHQRQREAKVGNLKSLAGFSYGVGLNLRRLRIDFAQMPFHRAGGSTHVGLLVDLTPGDRASRG